MMLTSESHPDISVNQSALAWWQMTGYTESDVTNVGLELDSKILAAKVNFAPGEPVTLLLTRRTFELQQGHYPTMAKFFSDVANHPLCKNERGSIFLWLEDLLWQGIHQYALKAPIIAFGKHVQDFNTFLIPDPAFLGSNGYDLELSEMENYRRWEDRRETIFWRGAASNCGLEGDEWANTPRGRLVKAAQDINDTTIIDAKLTRLNHLPVTQQQILNEVGVVGEEEDFNNFLQYRYLIDVDGYASAWKSCFLKLASGSTVLKIQSDVMQWYYPSLIPWIHYIPVSKDVSDIKELYHWLKTHPSEAKQIAERGNSFIRLYTYERAVESTALLCSRILDCQRDI